MASREYINIHHAKLHSNGLFTRFFVVYLSLFFFSPSPPLLFVMESQYSVNRSRAIDPVQLGEPGSMVLPMLQEPVVEISVWGRCAKPRWRNHLLSTRLHSQNHCASRYRVSILLSKSAFVPSLLKRGAQGPEIKSSFPRWPFLKLENSP